MQGRYILSTPKLTDFEKVADALRAAYPDRSIVDPVNRPPKIVYDTSKVVFLQLSFSRSCPNIYKFPPGSIMVHSTQFFPVTAAFKASTGTEHKKAISVHCF
jgi:hypothetical protein